jgi:protein-S-isoprenylcysteine O-methyltransferase Ste14
MFEFLIPLLIGFTFNSASAFTTFYSRHLGERTGRLVCTILRNVLGIPVWVIGYVMAVRAPSTFLFNPILITSILAWLLILAGVVIIIAGLITLKWRAAAPSVQDTLVVQGVYAYIRHPLYSGMILELTGLFVYIPTFTALVACVLGMIWVMVQARLEEIDLVERLPAYKEYMQRVPRFLPKVRLSKTGKT